MELRGMIRRGPALLRQMQVIRACAAGGSLKSVRHQSYQSSASPQPPLSQAFKAEKIDLDSGPVGPVHPKVKQLQKFFQTDNGKEIWRKTPLDEFLYRFLVAGAVICLAASFYNIWKLINPKPVKK